MVTILKTLRNNWKKSTFAAVVLAYGGNFAKDKIHASDLLRVYCEEARVYGEQPISNSAKPRHVTVILNPTARDKKGKKLYELYCEPLLNLAGIRVSTVVTEEEGQARDLMEIMENTDAVIIAGGDGTLHEAITGLLRRNDEASATKRLAIGIAPIGKTNSLAKYLFWKDNMTEPEFLAEATMSVIREITKPVDVMKIQGNENKPVFAVANFECGTFRDTDALIPKYWYFGFLKAKFTYVLAALKEQVRKIDMNITYTHPCHGCSKCYQKPEETTTTTANTNAKWWSAFVPRVPQNEVKQQATDYSQIINEKCGESYDENIKCSNISLSLLKENHSVRAEFHTPDLSFSKLISEGWSRHAGIERNSEENETISQTLSFSQAKLDLNLPEGEELWFNIDNENYEAQSVDISLIPSKVLIYAK